MNSRLQGVADPLAEQTAEWIVRLSADDPAERQIAAAGFAAWKAADPRHAAAAARLESLIGSLNRIRDGGTNGPARNALQLARKSSKRPGQRLLALAAALLLPGWLLLHSYPPAYLLADVRTTSGQWESRTLADGSRLSLNSLSAVNLDFDAQTRTVRLLRGEILVDVAGDASRPFIVETAHGSIRALGTRFVVSSEANASVLNMIESRVEVRPRLDGPALIVEAGESLRFGPDGSGTPSPIDARSLDDAWADKQLVVQDRPLADVLDELARHRPGHLHYDRAAVAGLRVSAVLPLADTDRALQLLAASFPHLRIRTLTAYLVMVDVEAR